MSGSKNRKNTKTTGTDYNKLKATDAANWADKINAVSDISFIIKTFSNLEEVLKAINAYFEILKYAFPKGIIARAPSVDKRLVKDADTLNDDLSLQTLKGNDEGKTVTWLKKVNDSFIMFANITGKDASKKETFVKKLTKECTRFNSLMRISPTYIGHKPLFKYRDVRAAFKKLGSNVANLPTLVQNATDNLGPNK